MKRKIVAVVGVKSIAVMAALKMLEGSGGQLVSGDQESVEPDIHDIEFRMPPRLPRMQFCVPSNARKGKGEKARARSAWRRSHSNH